MLSLLAPVQTGNDVEAADLTAAELRRIADRVECFGWCRGQEAAASVLREIARAIEMEGV